MNENIILERQLEIQGFHVIGQVAKSRERKELDPVLLRAQESNGTDGDDVAAHLLCEPSRKVVAQRLLQIGASLGLLKRKAKNKFVLTERGEKAIQTGKVFVPEHGAWTLWISQDPLLPSPILRVDDFDNKSAHSEVRDRRGLAPSFDELPSHLHDAIDKEITPPVSEDNIAIRIDELEEKAERASSPNAELTLLWTIGECKLRLEGTWEGKEIDTELQAPDVSFEEIWDALLADEGLREDWVAEQQALRVSFDEASDIQRKTMSCDLKFRNPSIPDYGDFKSFEVRQINIAARSEDDAREWATWRLKTRIVDFATSKLYDEWWKEASEPFNEFLLECPNRSDLAALTWESAGKRPDTRAWHLIAVEDWDLK